MYAPGVKGRSRHERKGGVVEKRGRRGRRRDGEEERGQVLGEDPWIRKDLHFIGPFVMSSVSGWTIITAGGQATIACLEANSIGWVETSRQPKKGNRACLIIISY